MPPRHFVLSLLLLLTGSLTAADYYWIGGGGNWSDIGHWATTSGGALTHSQAPTSEDDVYFDANSFSSPGQVVVIQLDIAFCRRMDWSGVTNSPTLRAGTNVTLNVFGSLRLSPVMTHDFRGDLVFTGSAADNTVDFGPHTAARTVSFDGAGTWRLAEQLRADSALIVNEGTLATGDHALTAKYFDSNTSARRVLQLGASRVTLTGNTLNPFFYREPAISDVVPPLRLRAENLTLDAGTSRIELTAPEVTVVVYGPGDLRLNQLALTAPTGSSRIGVFGRFSYDDRELASLALNGLELRHSTFLNRGMPLGDLVLAPGRVYTFASGEEFSLTSLTADGDCIGGVALRASDVATPARFRTTAPVTADFITLAGIAATGGASFTANNAIDLGNNPGWTINAKATQSFFWIGGTGDWNDPAHWATTSGGTASGCVPTFNDDVVFDANSFGAAGREVRLNVENAYCRSMRWEGVTNNPTLTGPADHNLRLSGSLTLDAAMQQAFAGDVYFQSDRPDNTITTNGQPLNRSLYLAGGGGWTLVDDLYVHFRIFFESGSLNTNDRYVNAQHFRSDLTAPRTLRLGTSTVHLESRDPAVDCDALWELRTDNLTLEAEASTIEFFPVCTGMLNTRGEGTAAYNNVFFRNGYGRIAGDTYNNAGPVTVTVDSADYDVSGDFYGNNRLNYVELAAGFTYTFPNYEQTLQTIGELVASGNCDRGFTVLRSDRPGRTARISLAADFTFDQLILQDLTQTGAGTLTANNSVDRGNTVGWIINEATDRTLFWVGNDGDWFATANWSLSSGGPGGACIPTALDDVIFDQNSFNGPNQFVRGGDSRQMYARNMQWTADVGQNPQIGGTQLRLSGSLDIGAPVGYYPNGTAFEGNGEHTISTGGLDLRFVEFIGEGTYRLLDATRAFNIYHLRGTLSTEGQDLTTGYYIVDGDNPVSLRLGDSRMRLTGESRGHEESFSVYGSTGLTIEPGQSIVEFTAAQPGILAAQSLGFGRVHFTNPAGTAQLRGQTPSLAFGELRFNGSARIDAKITTDSLIFSAGKSYALRASTTHTIDRYWQTIGNNCTPISLTSTVLGEQATVSMPAGGRLLADFVQMANLTATGGNDFLAGARSTDIDNSNVGWIFDSAPEFIDVGFLGTDRALCTGEPITLDAYNFTTGETYRWQDGSTDSTFVADRSGTYSVEVSFETNCVIRDEIEVLDAAEFVVELPENPVVCAGSTLTFDADVGVGSALYVWQDGSTGSTFDATVAGEYRVTVEVGGCFQSDSASLTVEQIPTVDLGPDLSRCAGESFTLDGGADAGAALVWQDGTTLPTLSGDQPGIYWLEASTANCTDRDSVTVTYVDAGSVDLGPDTTVCTNDPFTLTVDLPDATYVWQDGSSAPTFTVSASGTYFVTAEVSGCTASDTIRVTYAATPPPDLAPAYAPCAGELFSVTSVLVADRYAWSDGTTGPTFTTRQAGTYTLVATTGSCTVEQSFDLSFTAPPTLELGADRRACEDVSITLDAGQPATWQDGTTATTYPVNAAGRYVATVTNGSCTVTDSVFIELLPLPTFDLGEDQSACAGDALTLTVPSGLGTVSWSDGGSQTSRDFTLTGDYAATVTTVDGCQFTDAAVLIFNPRPEVDLGPDFSGCAGDEIRLSLPRAATWQDGTVTTDYAVTTTGTYSATVTELGCSTTDAVTVTVLPLPAISLGGDRRACAGETLTVDVVADPGQLIWEDGSDARQRTFTATTVLYAEIEDTNGCANRDEVSLTFTAPPVLDLGPDTTVCDNLPFELVATAGAGQLSWPDGSSGGGFAITAPGAYVATLTSGGCTATDTVTVGFRECTFFQAYLPNSFTPDQDGTNDDFRPLFDPNLEIREYQFRVYNRWGNLLFESANPEEAWDGTVAGQVVNTGVYLFAVEITFRDDLGEGREVLTGDVLVLP